MSKVNNSLDYNKNIEPLSDESIPDDISLSNYASDDDEPIEIYIKIDKKSEEKEKEVNKFKAIKQAFILAKNEVAKLEESDSSDDFESITKELEKLKFQNMKQEQPVDI